MWCSCLDGLVRSLGGEKSYFSRDRLQLEPMMPTVGSVELPEASRVNEEPREVSTYEQE